MKFKVRTTSGDDPKVVGCHRGHCVHSHDQNLSRWNVTEIKGMAYRENCLDTEVDRVEGRFRWRTKEDCWLVELGSIRDLMEFLDDYGGDVVLSVDDGRDPPVEIELYDTYRE